MTAALEAASRLASFWGPALDHAHRLGWHLGYRSGFTAAEREMQAAWSALARTVRTQASDPTRAELERRRTPDYQPCALACGTCSRCICAESYRRQGGRPFPGLRGAA